jgi:dipeptidyl aminopeptidase/acylaminoacyl peptidase
MGAVKTPELYRCAASINGVLDLPEIVSFDKEFIGGHEWTKSVGLEGEKLKSVSPYHQAEKIKIPMLLIHAKDDARVPPRQAERLAKQLKNLDQEVTLVSVEHGGHSMNNEQARTIILESLEQFLVKALGPNTTATAPSKTAGAP